MGKVTGVPFRASPLRVLAYFTPAQVRSVGPFGAHTRAETHSEHFGKTVTQVTTCDCNFLAEDVIKKTAGNNWSQARTTRERRWTRSQVDSNTLRLRNVGSCDLSLGFSFVLGGLPLDLQRDSVVVDHDGPTAALGSGDDLSHHRR